MAVCLTDSEIKSTRRFLLTQKKPCVVVFAQGDLIVDVQYVTRRIRQDEQAAAAASSEDEVETERGVSGAMANIWDPDVRIKMLLVHGMLHLVGYDHEDDDEYELMVTKEEELLEELGLPLRGDSKI